MNCAESEWKLSFDKCFDVWNEKIKNRLPPSAEENGGTFEHNYSFVHPQVKDNVPEKVAAIVDKLLDSNRRFQHVISLLSHEIVSTAIETGICGDSSEAEKSLQEALKRSDKNAIGAMIGFKLYDRCIQRTRKSSIEMQCPSETKSHLNCPVISSTSPSSVESPKIQSQSTQPDLRVSKESAWAYAYNLVNAKDSDVNNAVKVAKVIFDEIMTKDEVMNGSMRSQYIGEGSKRRKTEPFDTEKLNFIRDACAFVLNTPDRKKIGTSYFELARNDPNFKTLPPDIWQGLKMPVFSKHASLQRKKFEDEDEIKIVNVTSIPHSHFAQL